jgi:hypothetical protein
VADIEKMAGAIAKSKMFGMKTTEEAFALMLIAQAEGMHPAIAARDYHVIQGRPTLKADAMLARFQQAGGKVQWDVYTDAEVTGTFSHPQGGSLRLTWTFQQAKSIGLTGKDNWKNYPAPCCGHGASRRASAPCTQAAWWARTRQKNWRIFPRLGIWAWWRRSLLRWRRCRQCLTGLSSSTCPTADQAYAAFHTEQEWQDAYNVMADRIKNSEKLDVMQKAQKLDGLKACNLDMLDYLGTLEVKQ